MYTDQEQQFLSKLKAQGVPMDQAFQRLQAIKGAQPPAAQPQIPLDNTPQTRDYSAFGTNLAPAMKQQAMQGPTPSQQIQSAVGNEIKKDSQMTPGQQFLSGATYLPAHAWGVGTQVLGSLWDLMAGGAKTAANVATGLSRSFINLESAALQGADLYNNKTVPVPYDTKALEDQSMEARKGMTQAAGGVIGMATSPFRWAPDALQAGAGAAWHGTVDAGVIGATNQFMKLFGVDPNSANGKQVQEEVKDAVNLWLIKDHATKGLDPLKAGYDAAGAMKDFATKNMPNLGQTIQKAGIRAYEVSTPPTKSSAEIAQMKAAGTYTGDYTPAAESAMRQGVAGITATGQGINAEAAAADLWNNKISPALKASTSTLDFHQILDDLQATVNKTVEEGRKADLQKGLDALKEDYASNNYSSVDLQKANTIKSQLREFVPQKLFRGQDVASGYSQMRYEFAQAIGNGITDTIDDPTIKQAYRDWGNLQEIKQIGPEARTQAGLKGGAGRSFGDFLRMASRPLSTYGGKALWQLGKSIENTGIANQIVANPEMAITFLQKYGARLLKPDELKAITDKFQTGEDLNRQELKKASKALAQVQDQDLGSYKATEILNQKVNDDFNRLQATLSDQFKSKLVNLTNVTRDLATENTSQGLRVKMPDGYDATWNKESADFVKELKKASPNGQVAINDLLDIAKNWLQHDANEIHEPHIAEVRGKIMQYVFRQIDTQTGGMFGKFLRQIGEAKSRNVPVTAGQATPPNLSRPGTMTDVSPGANTPIDMRGTPTPPDQPAFKLGATPQSTIQATPNLRTFDFHELEGQKQTPAENAKIHKNIIDRPNKPMAPGGETFNQAAARAMGTINDILQKQGHAALVTHNSMFGLIKLWEEEGRPNVLDKAFRKKYTAQDNSNGTGSAFTIKGPNGDIHVIRHGETTDNAEGLFRRAEAQLTDKGRQQAQKVAKKLQGTDIGQIYSSDLPRAIETSEIIAKKQGQIAEFKGAQSEPNPSMIIPLDWLKDKNYQGIEFDHFPPEGTPVLLKDGRKGTFVNIMNMEHAAIKIGDKVEFTDLASFAVKK